MRRGSASASRNVTRVRQVPPSTSTADEHDGAQRAPAPLAAGEQAVDQQAERALELRARRRLRQLEQLLQALGGGARAQRRVAPARELARERAGGAEAVGQRGARAARASSPERADAEALQRLGQRGGLRAQAEQGDRQRRQVGGERVRAAGAISARRARARSAAASAAKRDGAAPMRAGAPSARRAAAITPSSVPPWRPRRPRASNQARPGGRLDRRADALQRASSRSHASATPAGSGATSRSVGQRASASPSRRPARTP